MKDEIKEILDFLKDKRGYYKTLSQDKTDKLLDYITNLQEENERLKETNVYCNRTDCIGRIKDSRKYDSVYQEKEDYKSRNERTIENIDLVIELIKQQPTGNDEWILERLNGIKYLTELKEGK